MQIVVESIHTGLTKNYNYYSRAELEKILDTWTEPYHRPFLKHHMTHHDPVGRVTEARFKRSVLKKGAYCSELKAVITDIDAQAKVKDGRYVTVSVGTVATGAICSVCGNDWARGYCEHRKGRVYDDKLCYWKLLLSEHDEVSFVNTPADEYAQVIAIFDQSQEDSKEKANCQDTIDKWRNETAMDKYNNNVEPADIVQAFAQTSPEPEQNTQVGGTEETERQTMSVEEQLQSLQAQMVQFEQKLETLAGQYAAIEGQYNAVIQQNTELARLIHSELLEHYCDVTTMAGIYENRDEALKAAENKKVIELRKEIATIILQPRPRPVETVTCPGGDGTVSVEAPVADKKSYTLYDLETALSKLL